MGLLLTALALWCLVINTRETAACIPAEKDALVAFNASIINDPYGRLSSWRGENCCDWSGVRCNKKTGHVIQLDLGGYALQGEISPSLAGLTNLVYLNLSQIDFGGVSIPEFIGSFKMLRILDLLGAHFGGPVPPQLGNLSRLQHFDLSHCHMIIIDDFHWVSKLSSLRYLDLSWLYLAASLDWLQAVNMLPLLQVLHLNDASLPATNLNRFPKVNFTTLKILDLKSNTNLNSSLPSWIWNLSSLSELDLSSCGLSGEIPHELGKLASLKFLGLADNKLEGVIPRSASRLCNLAHLDLSRNFLSGDITEAAKNMLPCMKRLQHLNLADNKLTGYISGWLEQMACLKVLDLSKNSLSGAIPSSIGNLSNLTYLDISFNSFEDTISELHFFSLSRLDTLILSSNSLKVVMNHSWVPPFQLREVGMHGCLVGPRFPTWLQSQTRIEKIDVGSTGISGVLPDWIWNFSSSLTSLNVSMNNVTGKLPASLEQLQMLTTLNMRYNKLEGNIPDLPTGIQLLDLSHNYLSGLLPHTIGDKELYFLLLSHNFISGVIPTNLCKMVLMEVIDLSHNNLSGELPNCWCKNSNLYIMDFSGNNFWGEIPSTIGSLSSLVTLHLSWNNLSGTLPTSFQSCNRLAFLDLAENKLSGNIPKWIGGLQSLVFLSLGSNRFSGEIPEELSQLHVLQYLDFGNNKLCGPVPNFLGNLTAMHLGSPVWDASPFLEFMVYGVGGAYFSVYITTLEAIWRGKATIFSKYFYVLKIIDLSANQLTGEIPSEIGFLSALYSLNLSRNHIGGSIPDEIRNMRFLEILDLSWNDLSGSIPQSFVELSSLIDLNLSYNDLSGKIPNGHQFATFSGSSYLGNVDLCGFPTSRICKHFDSVTYLSKNLQASLWGFASGFSLVCLILISSAAARKAYFQFTDGILDKLSTAADMKLHINTMLAGPDLSMPTGSQNSITLYDFWGPSTAAYE